MSDFSLTTPQTAGILYLVATPIGNLEDITFRAVRMLKEANLIAAEDTRHTGKLLHHFQIETPQISYHEHNAQTRIPQLIEKLQTGQTIALVSDAGMPGISDPGYELVCACADAGIIISPIPGPAAVISAIAASALPSDRFTFEGFLPVKGKVRTERLTQFATEPRTIVLYESPHRLLKTLTDLQTHLGDDRQVTVARELTKRYEEFWRGTVGEAIEHFKVTEPRGEFTIAIAGHTPTPQTISEADLLQQLATLINHGISPSKASRQLAQKTGLSKREIYQLSLQMKQEE
ncbi:16S rRNA (cytidine(1402)-2'-O)-methyltransferase [Leptothoe spongobia]|uniref:Ribosomal RNA small subunit methyltransferase I n=1 Tax=Leptothoe spongobia TAU-MAC 1115 TaxID=1967444 RepID=A0A947DGZ0_9CYAN|nr:16S rRNA (cytidine(1402)-2'-O)-methyltransferase [Leptothoe spongobia]MBT9316745.1 16S rRNA (cytidine(1402)-2'-O)-methyltransferase [Leptothoe spongobia TAU-MAC 1115]